jgi:hypothetical protein
MTKEMTELYRLFVVYIEDTGSNSKNIASNESMILNNELERMSEEADVAQLITNSAFVWRN